MTPDPTHVHIGNWLEQLSDVVIDAEKYIEEHGHEVTEEIRDWLEDAEQRFRDIVCAVAEHIIVDDQCGIPEHRYCIVCNRSQLAISERAVTALTRLSEELGLYEATDLDDNPLVRHLARAEEIPAFHAAKAEIAARQPAEICGFPSSFSNALCGLPPGHDRYSEHRFHRFDRLPPPQ